MIIHLSLKKDKNKLPMSIIGYVPFLINALEELKIYCLWRWYFTRSRLPDVSAGEAQHSHHAADPPRASGGCPPDSNPPRGGKVYRLEPVAALSRRMLTGPEAGIFRTTGRIWAMACAQTHL